VQDTEEYIEENLSLDEVEEERIRATKGLR
jgi:hypothetical protein